MPRNDTSTTAPGIVAWVDDLPRAATGQQPPPACAGTLTANPGRWALLADADTAAAASKTVGKLRKRLNRLHGDGVFEIHARTVGVNGSRRSGVYGRYVIPSEVQS